MLIPQLGAAPALPATGVDKGKQSHACPARPPGGRTRGGGGVPGPARRLGAPRETRCTRGRDLQRICPAPARLASSWPCSASSSVRLRRKHQAPHLPPGSSQRRTRDAQTHIQGLIRADRQTGAASGDSGDGHTPSRAPRGGEAGEAHAARRPPISHAGPPAPGCALTAVVPGHTSRRQAPLRVAPPSIGAHVTPPPSWTHQEKREAQRAADRDVGITPKPGKGRATQERHGQRQASEKETPKSQKDKQQNNAHLLGVSVGL